MTNVNKTVAKRLMEYAKERKTETSPLNCSMAEHFEHKCSDYNDCGECEFASFKKIARQIEAEQAELRAENERLRRDFYEPCARMGFTEHAHGIEVVFDAMSRAAQGHECRVDFKALDLLCDKLECGDANHRATAAQIRKAINGAKPQLPEGIEWPRFEDGELVRFGDEFVSWDGETHKVRTVEIFNPEVDHDYAINSRATHNFVGGKKSSHGEFVKRPEPEVLDADGVPIKVGDTVWYGHESECTVLCITRYDGEVFIDLDLSGANWNVGGVKPSEVTHRKPDTRESVRAEIVEAAKADYAVNLLPLFDRYEAAVLRELGGE